MRATSLASLLLASAIASPCAAHDLPGLIHDMATADVPESVKSFNRAYLEEGDVSTRAVLVNAFIWPAPATLRVCFDHGPVALRQKIATAMQEWADLTDGQLRLVFSDAGGTSGPFKECDGTTRYEIRIGFVRGGGHWSYIGTLGKTVFPGNSMNLDFDSSPLPSDETITEITKHETGHAVGFHHEHQSPAAPCDKWDWKAILTAYDWAGSTPEEREKSMHFNLDRLRDSVMANGQHAYTFTAYDPASIMHYSFPASMFSDGAKDPCYVAQPSGLSPMDRQAMKEAYPRQASLEVKTRSLDEVLANPKFRDFRDLINQEKQSIR